MNTQDIKDIAARFDISDPEAERIASQASNEAEFVDIWQESDWWMDSDT